jgi:hypothetical protein
VLHVYHYGMESDSRSALSGRALDSVEVGARTAAEGAAEHGDGPPSCKGFDDEVELALERLARTCPSATAELIAVA